MTGLFLALALFVQDPARITSPLSTPLSVTSAVLKWDQAAESVTDVQSFRFTLYGDGKPLFEMDSVTCGPPSGQTPPELFSCETPYPAVPVGVKQLQVQAWKPLPGLSSPQAVRVVR